MKTALCLNVRAAGVFFLFFCYTVVLLLTNLNQHIPAWKHNQFRLLIKAPHSPGERRREKKSASVYLFWGGGGGEEEIASLQSIQWRFHGWYVGEI